MGKVYNLSFTKVLEEMKDYKEGTIIESQRGDRYKLQKIGNKDRKFTRIENTKLRFMTYSNTRVSFRIVEENKQTDIQEIEELNYYTILSLVEGKFEENADKELQKFSNKINEIIRVVNKTYKEMHKEYCQNCGDKLTKENKYMEGMCNECKYGIDWEEK